MNEVLTYVRDNWQDILLYALNIIIYILIALYGKRVTAKMTLLKGLVHDNQGLTLKQITELRDENREILREAKQVVEENKKALKRMERFAKFLSKEKVEDGRLNTVDADETEASSS